MPRRDRLRAERHRVIEECLELDLGVAKHVGVRCAAARVLAQKFREDAVLVLGREVHGLDVDADQIRDRDDIDPVLPRRAVLAVVVVFPVLHEEAHDLVARFLKKPCRHRRIDAARHSHHDSFVGHRIH